MTARVLSLLCVLLAALPGEAQVRLDGDGDLLPPGALFRLGSGRWRHDNTVYEIACTRDGKAVLSLCYEQVRHWEAATGKLLATFPAQYGGGAPLPYRLALSPDDRRIAFHHDGAVVVRELPGGKVLHALKHPEATPHWCLAFSPDGGTLATAIEAKLFLWDLATGKLRAAVPWPEGRPWRAAFDPDGKTLYVAAINPLRPLCRVDATAERPRAVPWLEKAECWNLALSPDGKTLAVVGSRTLLLVEVPTGRVLHRLAGPDGAVYSPAAFSADGRTLALCDARQIFVFDVATGKSRTYDERRDAIFQGFALAPDGTTVYAGCTSRIRRWHLPELKEAEPAEDWRSPRMVAYAPSGSALITADGGGPVRLVDPRTGRELHRVAAQVGECRHVSFAPDGGSVVASFATPRGLHSLDVKTGTLSRPFRHDGTAPFALSPDHRLLAYRPDGANAVEVWDAAKHERVAVMPEPTPDGSSTFPPAFSPDGGRVVVSTHGQGIWMWDHRSGARVKLEESAPLAGAYVHVEFSPDGLLLAVGADWRQAVWDAHTGRLVAEVAKYQTRPVRFTSDGRGVVLSDDRHLKLFDLAEGRFVRELATGKNRPWCFALAPDATTLTTGQSDGTLLVWDGATFLAPLPRAARSVAEKELPGLWEALASDDARQVSAARWRLASADGVAAFLKGKLLSGDAPSAEAVAARIAALDDDRFEARERASRQLERWGERVEPALKRALADKPPLEMRRRLEELLAGLAPLPAAPATARVLRAVAVLEGVGDDAARVVLRALADGAEGERLAVAARAALRRLGAG